MYTHDDLFSLRGARPDEQIESPIPRRIAPGKVTLSGQIQFHPGVTQRKARADDDQGNRVAMAPSASGSPLPSDVQAKMERSFEADFSAVRVHQGPQAAAMDALAYTQGSDIHFAPGQYQPNSQPGQEILGHELAHVVQQSQGRVAATRQAKGTALNDDHALEREADVMGARAARGESAAGGTSGHTTLASEPTRPMQMKRAVAGVVQRLRRKSDNSQVAIPGLKLARIFDIMRRPDPDPDPGGFIFDPGDREALRAKADQLLPIAFATLRASQTSERDQAAMQARNTKVSGAAQQDLIDFMQMMATTGQVTGLEEWMANASSYLADNDHHAENRQDLINELWEAARRILLEGMAQVHMGETAIAGSAQTADLTLGSGVQVEIKTVRQPIRTHADLRGQLEAGIGKFVGAATATSEVTIFGSIDESLFGAGRSNTRKGQTTTVSSDPAVPDISTVRTRGDGVEISRQVQTLANELANDLGANRFAGSDCVRRVVVVLENARSYQATKQDDGAWVGALL